MVTSRPISYLTMKCVLKNLNPRLRFQLSNTCPSIRNLEKSIPMLIKYLKLTDNSIKVNQSTYQLSVINRTNPNPGYLFDIDEYGNPDDLRLIEQDSNEVRIEKRKDPVMEEILDLKRQMAHVLDKIQRFNGSLNNYALSENYIRLKVGRKVEVLSYERKMDEAMKYLIGGLFGGRNLKVLRLAIGCKTIIRIPETVKFHIQVLNVLDKEINASLDTVRLMLDESCLPLTRIVFWVEEITNYTNPLIDTARMVEFLAPETSSLNLLELANWNHNRVHATRLRCWRKYNFCDIVGHWLGDGKRVGTYFTFETSEKKIYKAMAYIRKEFEHCVDARSPSDNNQFSLIMNVTSNLVISKVPEGNVWVLGMRVEKRRHL